MSKHDKKIDLMFWSLELLIVGAIIFIFNQVSFIFNPIGEFVSSVSIPIVVAGVLYYLLIPIVKILTKIKIGKHHVPRTLAVSVIFICIALLLYYLLSSFVPDIIHQISNLISNMPHLATQTSKTLSKIAKHNSLLKNLPTNKYTQKIQQYMSSNAKGILSGLTSSLNETISMATNVVINAITIPIVLFYMLKDGYKLKPSMAHFIPKKHRRRGIKLLGKMSNTISRYISGQMIECLFVGTFTAIGYLIIHQPYAILLGVFAGPCNIIPYVGPYIGIAPSLAVASTLGLSKIIWVCVVVIIVQQIDGNFIYPNVVGKVLQIHPLTIIIILLAAGHIAGFLGMILAIPLYAVVKTVVEYLHSIYAPTPEDSDSDNGEKHKKHLSMKDRFKKFGRKFKSKKHKKNKSITKHKNTKPAQSSKNTNPKSKNKNN